MLRIVARKVDSHLRHDQSAVQPGPGGLFPGIVEAMTAASCDPDVHIHEWLRGKAPVGITAPTQPGGVFPVISPQSVGKEKDRARYLHAKVWGNANYGSYDEHKVQADELFHKEVQKGYVQRAASRDGSGKWALCIWPRLVSLSRVPR